jgi:hypothetical protein
MSIQLSGIQLGNIMGGPSPINLSDLNDVSIVSPQTGQYLRYNAGISEWQNSYINLEVYNFLNTNLTSSSGILLTKLSGPQTVDISLSLTASGDASGIVSSGNLPLTLSTVNSNVGQFAVVTVNGKGLVTAATTLSGDATSSGSTLTLATVNGSPQSDTFRKITVNGKGLVTATSAVSPTDITTALAYTPVNKAGDIMAGYLILNADPITGLGAATKQYVDGVASGITIHAACVTSTTAALVTSTYNNGVGGVGATLTEFGNGALGTIGGYAGLMVNDRLLVKDQVSQLENGIYVVTDLGSGGSPWILTRADDFDNSPSGEVIAGATTFIQNGTLTGTQWTVITIGTITVGTTGIVFSQLSGAGTYVGGTGINVTGNTITNTGVTSAVAGTNISVSSATGAVTFNVTGTVASASTATTATNLVGGAAGSLPYQSATGITAMLAGSTSGFVLTSTGPSSAPAWQAVAGTGTVTSVNVSGGTTGLTTSGGPITASGTITLAGILAVSNGGTGQATSTLGFNALAPSQTSNSGKFLTTDGTNTSWSTVSATSANNINGGTTGQIPYQSGIGTTTFSSALTFDGTATVFVGTTGTNGKVQAATNGSGTGGTIQINGGTGSTIGGDLQLNGGIGNGTLGGTIAINGGIGTTTGGALVLRTAPTSTLVDRLRITKDGEWQLGNAQVGGTTGQVLASNGTAAAPTWTNTPTLTGTNFSGIPNGALTNNSLTIGSTNIALGATSLTLAGLTSVASGAFIPTGSTVPANGLYLAAANTVTLATNTAERMRIDSIGNVSIGNSSTTIPFAVGNTGTAPAGITSLNALFSTDTASGNNLVLRKSATTAGSGASVHLIKSNGTAAAPTIVTTGDVLSALNSSGYDGTNYSLGTQIISQCEGTIAVGQIPGRLAFYTSNSAGTSTERMRIDSAGNAFLGAAAYTSTSLGLAATRRYLVISSPDAGSIGVITFVGQTGNQGNNGNIEWYDPGNTSSSSIRNAFIFSGSSGSTANNRGSFMAFATKPDGISGSGTEAMRIDSSGNLGIGLTAPVDSAGYGGKILDVNGPIYSRQNSDNTKYISIGTSAGASYIEANGSSNLMSFITTAVERMRLDSSGNALIGTTSASGTLTVDTSKGATGVVFGDIGTFANNTQLYMRTSGLAKFLNAGGSFTWGVSGGSEQMRLDASGNVGIGTTAPTVASGKGLAIYDSGGVARLQLRNPTTGDASTDGSSLFASGLDFGLENREAGNMLFYTNGALRQTIDSSGNVGIGAGTAQAKLDVNGATAGGAQAILARGVSDTNFQLFARVGATGSASGTSMFTFGQEYNGGGMSVGLNFLRGAGSTDGILALWAGNAERMRIDSSGNVGIGGTPTYKLDVQAVGSPVIRVASTDGSGVSAYLQANSNVGANIGAISNHPLLLVTNSIERMRITTAGDVGIGVTPSGTYKLEVSGSISATSFTGAGTGLTGTAASLSIGGNAATVGGFTPSQSAGVVNRVVVADGSGYIFNNYFNGTDEGTSGTAGTVTSILTKRGDNYYRSTTAGSVATFLSGQTMNIVGSSTSCTGNSVTATTATTANALATGNNYQVNSLGVGTAASGTAGEIRATNNITAFYSSDIRLKENVKVLEGALDKINAIRGVSFDWTQAYIDTHGGEDGFFIRKHEVGVIAQEVELVLPEIVADRPDGYKGVQYEKLVPLLIEAVKELTAKVKELENRL